MREGRRTRGRADTAAAGAARAGAAAESGVRAAATSRASTCTRTSSSARCRGRWRCSARITIVHIVNLSGGSPGGDGLEETLAEAEQVGHTTVFVNPDFREIRKGAGLRRAHGGEDQRGHALGARGVKISKGLGLGYTDAQAAAGPGRRQGLDPVFEIAGKLGMPIAIHTGDPKAFWQPPTPDNERFDELRVHPGWSFFGAPVTGRSSTRSSSGAWRAIRRRSSSGCTSATIPRTRRRWRDARQATRT